MHRILTFILLGAALVGASASLLCLDRSAGPDESLDVGQIAATSAPPPAEPGPIGASAPRLNPKHGPRIAWIEAAGRADRPALRELALSDRDPMIVAHALQALARVGGESIARDPVLVALLDDPRPRVRQELVRTLGRGGDVAAIEVLASIARDGSGPLRHLALRALGDLGGPEATRLLESIRDDADAPRPDRVFAETALRRDSPQPLRILRRR